MKTFKFTNPQFTTVIEVETDLVNNLDDNMTIHDIKLKAGSMDKAVAAGFSLKVPDVVNKGDFFKFAKLVNADLIVIDGSEKVENATEVINIATELDITTQALDAADSGVAYEMEIEYEGGTEPVKLSLNEELTDLPTGLDFDTKTNKLIGEPSDDGNFSITIDAVDALDQIVTETYILTVNA